MDHELMRAKLESLRRVHYICEDPFYSCPKSDEYIGPPFKDPPCYCRADQTNATIDELLLLIKED